MEIPPVATHDNLFTAIIYDTSEQCAAITQNICRRHREQRKVEHVRHQVELTTPRNQCTGKQTKFPSPVQNNRLTSRRPCS